VGREELPPYFVGCSLDLEEICWPGLSTAIDSPMAPLKASTPFCGCIVISVALGRDEYIVCLIGGLIGGLIV